MHGAGLLGVTGAGWFIAAIYSVSRLPAAALARDALLTLHVAQAALFQCAAGVGFVLLISLVMVGFLLLGGESVFLPELSVVDPFSVGGVVVLALWIVAIISLPAWHAVTLALAWRATRRSVQGVLYAYPFIGDLVWEEAPRVFKWLKVAPEDGDPLLESP